MKSFNLSIFFVISIFCICFQESVVFAQGDTLEPKDTAAENKEYFPLPDTQGGWRTVTGVDKINEFTGMDKTKLDEAYDFVRSYFEDNGGLLVARHGYLVYERYFGKGQRDATPNLASCGKSFTSIAVGILMNEYPELFPDGLEQKIFTSTYLPAEAFSLPDSRMADIKLGQLLSFSAGIRGNNPVSINGKFSVINPAGPDGWYACVDKYALGIEEGKASNGVPFSTKSLWCEPGGGYSYATASIHIASIMLRYISGLELQEFIETHLAKPLGWGTWGWGYKNSSPLLTHTPGGAGICLRSTDMLRFCYMLLHDGQWKGEQVVPKEYIGFATNASPYNPHAPYSLQFNVNTDGKIKGLPTDAYWKTGSGGHAFYIVPSLDLVVWRLGGRDNQYSSGNTGLPFPDPISNAEKAITKSSFQRNATAKVLKMVINSIVDED